MLAWELSICEKKKKRDENKVNRIATEKMSVSNCLTLLSVLIYFTN